MRALPLLVIAVLLAALGFGLMHKGQGSGTTAPGFNVDAFSLPPLEPNSPNVSSADWRGHITLVNIFASWCIPCAQEHPMLMQLQNNDDIVKIGIAWKDKPENIRKWLKDRGNPYDAVALDEKGASTIALGLSGVPETLLLDRQGRVVFQYKAALTDDMIREQILPLVEKLEDE